MRPQTGRPYACQPRVHGGRPRAGRPRVKAPLPPTSPVCGGGAVRWGLWGERRQGTATHPRVHLPPQTQRLSLDEGNSTQWTEGEGWTGDGHTSACTTAFTRRSGCPETTATRHIRQGPGRERRAGRLRLVSDTTRTKGRRLGARCGAFWVKKLVEFFRELRTKCRRGTCTARSCKNVNVKYCVGSLRLVLTNREGVLLSK